MGKDEVRRMDTCEAVSDFDRVLTDRASHIGYMQGSEKVLFIKGGQGGSIYGYRNRYLDLAARVRRKYGCSVFVAATSEDDKASHDGEMRTVRELVNDPAYRIYYLGISKGGLIGCWYGADEPRIRRIVTVNAPLMINFHNRTRPALKKLTGDRLTMVYGSRDPSYPYIPFVRNCAAVRILDGAGHNLENSPVSLSSLVEELLLFDLR